MWVVAFTYEVSHQVISSDKEANIKGEKELKMN